MARHVVWWFGGVTGFGMGFRIENGEWRMANGGRSKSPWPRPLIHPLRRWPALYISALPLRNPFPGNSVCLSQRPTLHISSHVIPLDFQCRHRLCFLTFTWPNVGLFICSRVLLSSQDLFWGRMCIDIKQIILNYPNKLHKSYTLIV